MVLDLGQVLASPAELYRAPAALIGVDAAAYEARYWTHRRAYDTGGPDADYWQVILDGVGVQPSVELVEALTELDAELWTQLRPSAHQLLETVRSWNVGTALLSNAPLALGRAVRRSD